VRVGGDYYVRHREVTADQRDGAWAAQCQLVFIIMLEPDARQDDGPGVGAAVDL
jgi:hypothetical protein